jgi:transposase
VPDIVEDADNGLPGVMRALVQRLWEHFQELDRHVGELDREIRRLQREDEASRRLAEIPGIGVLSASALAATVGDAKAFANGRQLAAWLGLVARQHSSGGKEMLMGISKRGDCYVRTLLIHGARAVIQQAERRNEADSWLKRLLGQRNKNVATVAVAAKNARIAWAILAHGRDYDREYQPVAP